MIVHMRFIASLCGDESHPRRAISIAATPLEFSTVDQYAKWYTQT
jgi:hypothetical protein